MAMRTPDRQEMIQIAALHGFQIPEMELLYLEHMIGVVIKNLNELDAEAQAPGEARYGDRHAGERPTPADDPLNAILRRCSVKGSPSGKLAGKRVGLKDCILVAGVPMSCGSLVLDGYVPDRDATIVTRILDAGAEIVAKLNMDNMGFAGNGDTSAFGRVRNPHNHEYLAGGSSSGSGAALYYDDIDLAVGVDSAGSIRIPASFCGVVGIKPTHGLVPQTNILGLEPTIDHPGPMARTVADAALLLEVLVDSRAEGRCDYMSGLDGDVGGLRIGVVKEGFAWGTSEPDVDAAVKRAIESLAAMGAIAEEVSIPLHRRAGRVLTSVIAEGMTTMMANAGLAYNGRPENHHLAEALARGLESRGEHLPEMLKANLLLGSFLKKNYPGKIYQTGQSLRRAMREQYDRALEKFDILAMPTTPQKAPRYDPKADLITRMLGTRHVSNNTAALNMTGHPSLNLPCASSEGLPIGLMLTGRYFDEATLIRVAHAFEQNHSWQTN